jgi:hypothetical protein
MFCKNKFDCEIWTSVRIIFHSDLLYKHRCSNSTKNARWRNRYLLIENFKPIL